MNDHNFQTQSNTVNLSAMSVELIKKLRSDCDKEIEKRFKLEVRKFKAEMKRKAEKYGLVVKVEKRSN